MTRAPDDPTPTTWANRVNDRLLYILPVPRFFSQCGGVGGHIAHTQGVVDAFARCGYRIEALAEEPHAALQEDDRSLHRLPLARPTPVRRLLWGHRLARRAGELARATKPQFCYVRYSVGFAPILHSLRRRLGAVPMVLEVSSIGAQRRRWLGVLERHALTAADLIVCVSETVRDVVAAVVPESCRERLLVLPNGVDVGRFAAAEREPPAAGEPVRFGYVGVLKPDYGLEDLLRAFARAREREERLHLHIYGDGPARDAIAAGAARLEGVELHGPIPFPEVPAVLATLHALVYTTTEKYTFQSPIKLLEYMAAGRPIVAAETPQVRKLLGDGQQGLLYPVGDIDAFANRMLEVVRDPDGTAAMARAGRRAAEDHHSWDHRITDLLAELDRRGLLAR